MPDALIIQDKKIWLSQTLGSQILLYLHFLLWTMYQC
jgi:hypothetical protein